MAKHREHSKVTFCFKEPLSVRAERLDDVASKTYEIERLFDQAQYAKDVDGHLRSPESQPLLFIYDDDPDLESPLFPGIRDYGKELRGTLGMCLDLALPGHVLRPQYKTMGTLVAVPISAFDEHPGKTLDRFVEEFRHFYDETGRIFDDGDIQPRGLEFSELYNSEKEGKSGYWYTVKTPKTTVEKGIFAASAFAWTEGAIEFVLWYFHHFYSRDVERILEKMTLGHEDTSAYSEYLRYADSVTRPPVRFLFDEESGAVAPEDEALQRLDGLSERIESVLYLWESSMMFAAVPDFRSVWHNDEDHPADYESLAEVLGTKSYIEAYYSGVPIEDIIT